MASPRGSRAITFQGFDPMGRERSRLEVKDGDTAHGATTTHAYDALGRLSSSVETTGTTDSFNQQFTYDPLGNILGLSDSVPGAPSTTLTYLDTDRDRICRIRYGADSDTACNVTYDEVGNIVAQATPTGQRQYSYFIDGSIRTITDDHGSTAHFRYDAFGDIQELDLDSTSSPDTRTDRRYGALIARRKENIGGTPKDVWLRKIPGPDGFVATLHGPGGPWTFEFGESRGNRFVTDDTGAFVQDIAYHPFGKTTSTGAQPGDVGYTREQWNFGDSLAAFGITQVGARLYDPAIGRFLSRDPLLAPRTAATTNPYAFASNDPVNHADPTGLRDDYLDIGIGILKWLGNKLADIFNGDPQPWVSGQAPIGGGYGSTGAEGSGGGGGGGTRGGRNGDAIRAATDLISSWAPIPGLPIPARVLESALPVAGKLATGFGKAAWNMAAGAYNMVSHPVDTAAAFAHMALNPVETIENLGSAVYHAVAECVGGDVETCGGVIFNVITLPGGFAKAGKVLELLGAGELVEDASVIIYHGTTSSSAARIAANGFRAGADGLVYFAEDFATGKFFGELARAERLAKGATVLRLEVPGSLASMLERGLIGEFRGAPFIDIGGTGYELVLSSENLGTFNRALLDGTINVKRLKVRTPQ